MPPRAQGEAEARGAASAKRCGWCDPPHPGGGAQQHAECSICFDDLCEKPCAVLKRGDERVCCHFFHEHCARQLPSQHCPMCRADFLALERLPLLSEDAEGWFRCVALGNGELKKNQVRGARPRPRTPTLPRPLTRPLSSTPTPSLRPRLHLRPYPYSYSYPYPYPSPSSSPSPGPGPGPGLGPGPSPSPSPNPAQVMEALVTQFPLDVERFEEALEQLWLRWDHDQDGAPRRLHTVRPLAAPTGCAAGPAQGRSRACSLQRAWGELRCRTPARNLGRPAWAPP